MSKGWSHQKIVFAIRERGSTIAQLSRDAGYERRTLHAALYKRHPRAHAVIAGFLKVSRHELWPHWYGPDDQPLPPAAAKASPGARRRKGRS
jgi:Ner family transcriptional regulator